MNSKQNCNQACHEIDLICNFDGYEIENHFSLKEAEKELKIGCDKYKVVESNSEPKFLPLFFLFGEETTCLDPSPNDRPISCKGTDGVIGQNRVCRCTEGKIKAQWSFRYLI